MMKINRLFTLCLFLCSSVVLANDSAPVNLQYEPIQPLVKPAQINQEKARLGEKLFNDSILSRDMDLSCASCHNLQSNGADTNTLGNGRNNTLLDANTLTVFNSSLNHQQFWDGRALTLEEQINFVINSNKEFFSSWPLIIDRLKKNNDYRYKFKSLYGDGITADNVRNAIATFERTLITTNSRFDQYLLGDNNAINSQEKNGYRLFKSYGCVACHQGSNVGGNMFMKLGVFGNYYSEKKDNLKTLNYGLYNITKKESDRFVFRVPSLRLVTLTAPYFHDGSIQTLKEAIKTMAKHQLGRNINNQHIEDIIAFLKTLPGDYQGEALYEKYQSKSRLSK